MTKAQKRYAARQKHFKEANAVHDAVYTRGITSAARRLGVSYNHLWKVLTGKYHSPSLLLKIERQEPSLLTCSICTVNLADEIERSRGEYTWDEGKGRYVKLKAEA